MKRNHYIFLGMALVALPSLAQVQTQSKDTTMNRTVVVEQEYNPIILDASKVNVLPKVEEPVVNKKEVEYAISSTPASNIPVGTMQAYTGKEVQPTSKPGYVRAGYGNYGNLDLLGNYLFHLSSRDKLNVNFSMDGMNGTLDMPYGDARKWDAHYYRTRAAIDYLHQFGKVDLNVAGHFGLSNFNYEPYGFSFKKQKFTSGDLHFGVKSTDETMPLQFNAETNLMLYDRQHNQFFGGVNETQIRTKAIVNGNISDEQQISIAFKMNNLIYNNKRDFYNEEIKSIFKSRTVIDLNPYYELNNDDWRLHLGANVDFSFGNGKSFRVSPDVTIQYVFSDSYVVYANATGGRQLNDLRRLETYNPYSDPSNEVRDTYEQLNATLGFKASPVTGLWFNLFAGYQNLKDDLYQIENSWIGGTGGNFIDLRQTTTNNIYAGLSASYTYKDLFTLSGEGIYRHWKASDAYTDNVSSPNYNPALWMKPETELNFKAEIHPIPVLWLNVGYQYIWRAERYYGFSKTFFPAVSDLSIGATYHLFKGVSVYAKADNLLNKKFQRYLLYPTEGINFLGGLSFRF